MLTRLQPLNDAGIPVQAKYWTLSTLLIYCSPSDIVYKTMITQRHPVRVACRILDAIDDMTTTCNTVEMMHRQHGRNMFAPYIAALALKKGGALFRYFEAKGRGACEKFTTPHTHFPESVQARW